MEKSKDRLFELRHSCSRGDHSATEPKSDPQAEAPAIGNRHQFLDLIDEPFTTLAVAVEGIVDLLYITPNERKLRLELVSTDIGDLNSSGLQPLRLLSLGGAASGPFVAHFLRPMILMPRGLKLSVLVSPPT